MDVAGVAGASYAVCAVECAMCAVCAVERDLICDGCCGVCCATGARCNGGRGLCDGISGA